VTQASYGHSPKPGTIKRRWRTPRPLFDAVNARYSFTLDAAAEDGRLVASYITPEMDALVTPWADHCPANGWGERWAWFNPPWGARCAGFAGTLAFTRRAIVQRSVLTGVVCLLPTAVDTRWYRELFTAAAEVRLLPRVRFEHPDTGEIGESPPGCGMTLFELRAFHAGERRVLLADSLGRVA
jgi:phage N-6-adenine-methyltransferase